MYSTQSVQFQSNLSIISCLEQIPSTESHKFVFIYVIPPPDTVHTLINKTLLLAENSPSVPKFRKEDVLFDAFRDSHYIAQKDMDEGFEVQGN